MGARAGRLRRGSFQNLYDIFLYREDFDGGGFFVASFRFLPSSLSIQIQVSSYFPGPSFNNCSTGERKQDAVLLQEEKELALSFFSSYKSYSLLFGDPPPRPGFLDQHAPSVVVPVRTRHHRHHHWSNNITITRKNQEHPPPKATQTDCLHDCGFRFGRRRRPAGRPARPGQYGLPRLLRRHVPDGAKLGRGHGRAHAARFLSPSAARGAAAGLAAGRRQDWHAAEPGTGRHGGGVFARAADEPRSSDPTKQPHVWVVLDPVMISTSGSRLMDEDAQQTLIDEVFPYVDVITPNKFEAEALLGRTLDTARDVEQAAHDLLQLGPVPAVLIKGGHTTATAADDGTNSYARDYLLVRKQNDEDDNNSSSEPRLCDGHRGVWLQSPRYDTIHTHGTGCTLSSSLAAALALGEASRQQGAGGAWTCLDLVDATCLAKAYVSAGIAMAVPLGQGPGPVAQTVFPDSHEHYPSIITTTPDDNNNNNNNLLPFRPLKAASDETQDDDRPRLGRILPIVDSVEWVERLCAVSKTAKESSSVRSSTITDVQLRIKGETDTDRIREMVQKCQALCQAASVRLWINDYWEAAVEAGCFGVHVGQEDLCKMFEKGGLNVLRKHNMALGISTHSFGELAVALGVEPSYISLGPVFATGSKNVQFDPQGLEIVSKWRQLIPPDVPLVTIGGIGDSATAFRVRQAGSDCVAVIGAVTSSQKAKDIASSVASLNEAMA